MKVRFFIRIITAIFVLIKIFMLLFFVYSYFTRNYFPSFAPAFISGSYNLESLDSRDPKDSNDPSGANDYNDYNSSNTNDSIDEIISTYPKIGDEGVELYTEVIVDLSEDGNIESGFISVDGMKGKNIFEDNRLIFRPDRAFMPGTIYHVKTELVISDGESKSYAYDFKTVDVEPKEIWVEVNLKDINLVTIYAENMPIKFMLASGGIQGNPDRESIIGTYYLRDRGESFWSERFNAGGLYWVRIEDQYLFHSVPIDEEGNIREEELHKLGTHASHGCIRLSVEDALWFYENVPYGTMVVIHN